MTTPDRRQSKTLILSTNVDQNLLETDGLNLKGGLVCFKQLSFTMTTHTPQSSTDYKGNKTEDLALNYIDNPLTHLDMALVICFLFLLIKCVLRGTRFEDVADVPFAV